MKFDENRPLILQLNLKHEGFTTFFYKEEKSNKFMNLDLCEGNFEEVQSFSIFLRVFLDGKIENFKNIICENILKASDSLLIIKFLRILNLNEDFFETLILKCAAHGSKHELLAALSTSYDIDGKLLSIEAQDYLSDMLYEGQLPKNIKLDECKQKNGSVLASDSSLNIFEEDFTNNGEDEESEASSESSNSHMYPSVLHTAVENTNKEVINHLITHCTHLIQQLQFKHQIRISTAAFETNQFDILCDLLEFSDFPFPQNFKIDSFVHEGLSSIVENRTKFHVAIETASFKSISNFINKNMNLKIIYSPANKSALKQAMDSKKFKLYFHLKSIGFHATEFQTHEEVLSDEELKKANQYATKQRRKNVKNARRDLYNSVMILRAKSFIHNRKTNKDREEEYRKKIKNWYEDIFKIEFGPELLNVAASSYNLKIIFDFESYSVENVAFKSSGTVGTTYLQSKWIFIGAKFSNKENEQKIKGTLAHELCHYVMNLVYENDENPYYKHSAEIAEKFKAIVKKVKCSLEKSKDFDDECNEIISIVFRIYKNTDFHQELIVRVVEILAYFDYDEKKLNSLKNIKYVELFEFFRVHVLPDLRNFNLASRENTRKVNRLIELLPSISSKNVGFSVSNDIKKLINNHVTIAISNVPKLLLINIYNHLNEEYGDLLDTKNIFISPEKLNNPEIFDNFQKLLEENLKLNIFVDCTEKVNEKLTTVANKTSNFIFIVSNNSQIDKITEWVHHIESNPAKIEMNYKWSDLTIESQKEMLKTRVNFQNNLQFSFYDLLKRDINSENLQTNELIAEIEEQVCKDFSEIVDDSLLNLLMENPQIIEINKKVENEAEENYFELLFLKRKFIEKRGSKQDEITQEKLLSNIKFEKYVIISDIAGTGKSWTMKNFTNILRELYPKKWVFYVDLKQFIKEYNPNIFEADFLTFMIEKIIKPKYKFETKIFANFYKNGKVVILFDAFDEIAPDYAEFISNIAISFKSNEGNSIVDCNQLWIATRDYFEVNLKQTLKHDITYKLDEFTKENGINLIARSWFLKDQKYINYSKDDFEICIKDSQQFENYQEIARVIVEKVSMSKYRTIGLPQMFKMIANAFEDYKKSAIDLKDFIIYKKFAENLYKRWSYGKGKLRKTAAIKNQSKELNFWKFHQFGAIKSLFPKFSNLLYRNYDESEWAEEEIVACGLMSKKNGNFYFLHETFREFFIADFIAKILRRPTISEVVLEIFLQILIIKNFGVIRMFLNDAIENHPNMERLQEKMVKNVQYFYDMESFDDFFTKNLENLVDYVITVLKIGDYEKVKVILNGSVHSIVVGSKTSKMFLKFQNFLCNFLKAYDLKNMIISEEIFLGIIESCLDIEIFENFVTKIEELIGTFCIIEGLQLTGSNGNIFSCLCRSSNLSAQKVHNFLKILSKYLTNTEIFNLIEKCNQLNDNVFQICIHTKDHEKLKIIWTEIENFSSVQNLSKNFKELVMKSSSHGNILHWSVFCEKIEFHQVLWELLLRTCENREDLKNFIIHEYEHENKFFHHLIEHNKSSSIIDFTFKIFKENFTNDQFCEILKSQSKEKRNLLKTAAFYCENIQIHGILWENYEKSFEPSEILEFIKHLDEDENNLLFYTLYGNTKEIVELTWEKIKGFMNRNEQIEYLKTKNKDGENLIKMSLFRFEGEELREWMEKLMCEYGIQNEE